MKKTPMKYSIIIMVEEESQAFSEFIGNLNNLFTEKGESFEVLIVANGTSRFVKGEIATLDVARGLIKVFEFNTRAAQAVCLRAAVRESKGEYIVACGTFQQITNESISRLVDSLDENTDMVCPWREHRKDTYLNQLQSKIFNTLVRVITGATYHDLSCRIRVGRREVFEETEIYGNMYRFLPILAEKKGFRIKEVKCDHCARDRNAIFYQDIQRLSSYFTRVIDVFVLYFNTRFTRKPLRFFSALGMLFLFVGMGVMAYVFSQKVLTGHPVGGRPILLLAILFSVLGVQAASVGLLGEIIAFVHGRHKKEYRIEKVI